MDNRMNELDTLLTGDPDALVAKVQSETRALLSAKQQRIVFFGAGRLGEIALSNARRAGLVPVAFADNNQQKWETEFQGVPVVSPQAAATHFGADCVFVITVYTSAPVWRQLREFGLKPISFACLAWLYPAEFLPHAGLELPHKIFQNASAVREAAELWSDEESRAEFAEQIRWRTTLRPEVLRPHPRPEDTYFADDLFSFTDEEVFVDCGAFDGDSIRAFIARSGGKFRKITGLEPDPLNRERFQKLMSSLPSAQRERIELLPYAVGEKRETLLFDVTGTAASVVGSGKNEVECAPLDEVLSAAPTFIKMDIEGAEPMALRGAANLLRANRPILAICLYHAVEHLWEIPQWLKQLVPSYELFFRRYADECWEIVCYAVPRERCKRP
jgi:FkbM family methyltransferase